MWAAIKSALSGGDERRVATRVTALGTVHIDSRTYPLENWSASGVLFSGHDGRLAKGQRFKLRVEVQGDRGPIEFSAEAVVIRTAGDKLAAQFFMIDKVKKRMIMEYFARVNGGR
ncbi:MAG: PilZ domain-containing protein [Thalassobaculum sp.]|uniref:PilZ domain-containing protein n=1 Tax=Thalassobaculum sp. TaxID=2022740 RepID=UPI0032ED2436